MPFVVGREESYTSRRGYPVIVSMLSHGEHVYPIVLFLVDVWQEVYFDNLVTLLVCPLVCG